MISAALNDALAGRKRILLAGAGGGYDILGAVPLLVDLLATGECEVHLASLFGSMNSSESVGHRHGWGNLILEETIRRRLSHEPSTGLMEQTPRPPWSPRSSLCRRCCR